MSAWPGASGHSPARTRRREVIPKVTMGNVLTRTPPLVISEGDLDRGLDILEGCIGEVG